MYTYLECESIFTLCGQTVTTLEFATNAYNEHYYAIIYISMPYSPAARGGNLAKIPPNQVIGDFGRGSSVESESE